jgi:hypothetical protein
MGHYRSGRAGAFVNLPDREASNNIMALAERSASIQGFFFHALRSRPSHRQNLNKKIGAVTDHPNRKTIRAHDEIAESRTDPANTKKTPVTKGPKKRESM